MKILVKIISITLVAAIFAPLLAACQSERAQDDDAKLSIVATIFPVYDFAKTVAGDRADVTMLISPGVESHTYDPTPRDIIDIGEADMFLYVGDAMETWAKTIIGGISSEVNVVSASDGIVLLEEEHDDEHDGHSHNEENLDPHVWTDPTLAAQMAENIRDALIELDPDGADYYTANCLEFTEALYALDQDIYVALYGTSKAICFGGRFAMRYFARRYGLTVVCPYDSCGDESEPSARDIADVMDYIEQNDVKYIFHEELSVSSVATTIAQETGAELLLLHSCHNVSKDDFDAGVTYLSIMRDNLENLEKVFD